MNIMKKTESVKKIKNKTNKAKNNNRITKFPIWVLVFVILVIVITNTLFTFAVCFPDLVDNKFNDQASPQNTNTTTASLTPAEKVESTIISNGLAIIGIAVSVWAGLNIIQILEKGKLDELKKEVSQYSENRRLINRNKFLSLLQATTDQLSQYLYRQFSEIEENIISAEQYFYLGKYESMLCLVVECHKNDINYDIERIKKTINEMQHFKNMLEYETYPKLLNDYIELRLGEFFFYLGYKAENNLEKKERFCAALCYYYSVFPNLKKQLQKGGQISYLDNNIEFTNYMLNTIGECYSKLLQSQVFIDENDKDIAEKCYNQLSINMANYERTEKEIVKETYFRNHGCMLEHINKNIFTKDISTEIMSKYQKAMDVSLENNTVNNKVFKVWLSYHHKIMDSIYKKENRKNVYKQYSVDLIGFTKKAEIYAQLAVSCYPEQMQFQKYQAFICRDLCLLYHYIDNSNLKADYLSQLQKFANKFEIIYNEENRDPFVKQIISQSEELKKL